MLELHSPVTAPLDGRITLLTEGSSSTGVGAHLATVMEVALPLLLVLL